MAELNIDMAYGNALFQAAKDVNKVEEILAQGKNVLEIFNHEPDFRLFFNDPTISAKEKKQVFQKVFEKEICEELLNFLYILIDKGRSRHYEKILIAYEDLVNKEEGVAYGKVFSATPLLKEQIEKLEKETGNLIREKVGLKNEIDSSLIGGIKILIDGKIIDASIKARLQDLGNTIR